VAAATFGDIHRESKIESKLKNTAVTIIANKAILIIMIQ
jgi:hypothetical protein